MKLVKTSWIVLILLVASCSPFRYLPDEKEVPQSYRDTFKDQKKEYKKVLKEVDDWDFFIPPIEAVPEQEFSSRGISGITNWGEQILLPGDLRNRLRQECTNPVTIRILDTGAKWDHPDLQTGQLPGKNYSGDGTDVDVNGHSTHVAGIIFGKEFGLAWDLADLGLLRVQPLEVLRDAGQGSFTWVAQAINDNQKEDFEKIKDNESVIYNGSLGGGSQLVKSVEEALEASTREGVYFVFASGNNGRYVEYPGKSEYTLATAALTESLKKANFSSPGPEVFWAMPGVSINSTYRGGNYAKLSGTSMASPFATAGLAIALSKWGREHLGAYYQVKKYFEAVCTDIEPDAKDDLTGWGIAYVTAILDTDPATIDDDPQDPPTDPEPPQPDPDRPTAVTYTFDLTENYRIKWNRSGEKEQFNLSIPEIRFQFAPTKRAFPDVFEQIKAECDAFFKNRGMTLLPHHDQFDATYYAMRFLFMLKFKDIDIDLIHVVSEDPQNKSRIFRGDLMNEMYEEKYQSYIDTSTGRIKTMELTKTLKPITQEVTTYKAN
jgi:hypothetical protein